MGPCSDVLFVSGTLEVGGSETKIVKIANALTQSGYSAGIAYLNPPDTLLEKISPDVPVTHLQRHGKFSIKSLRRLRSLAAGKYRVVMAVNYYPLLYVIPAVKYLSPNHGRTMCLINTTKFVDGQRDWGRIYAPFLRRCSQLIFGCEAQKKLWTTRYKLPIERSTHIYNGVDADYFSPDADFKGGDSFRAEFGIPEGAIVIGSAGRLAPEKNYELLIRSVGKLRETGRDAYLILAGEGRTRVALETAAGNCGILDKLVLPGVLSDIRPAISAMDIFALPSYSETFSNAALEAMAMTRPVVLSRSGGAAEMVEDGKSGFLFDVADIGMLADLLVKLYDSKQMRDRVGRAARQQVTDRFLFAVMLDKYKALIDAPLCADDSLRRQR